MSASGVYGAAITPRRPGPEIDLAATFELLDFLSRSGVAGLVLMGSTGEFTHFPIEERSRLVSLAVKRSRIPVLAGVGHSTLEGALALSRDALDAGAAGLLLMPPYFFRYSGEDVRQFYLRYADELKESAPVYLYNIPAFTNEIPIEVAVELISGGAFAGIKDSSASWDNFVALEEARRRHPFALLAGHDILFARARAAGADGIVSGVASAVPELLVALDRAILAGKQAETERLDCRLQEFVRWLDAAPAPAVIREAAAVRGLRTGRRPCRRRRQPHAGWPRSWSGSAVGGPR